MLSTEPALRKSGCRPRNTAFDRAVRLSTEGVRFVGMLLESNLKVFFNIFLSEFVVRQFSFLGTALVNCFIACFHVARCQAEKKKNKKQNKKKKKT